MFLIYIVLIDRFFFLIEKWFLVIIFLFLYYVIVVFGFEEEYGKFIFFFIFMVLLFGMLFNFGGVVNKRIVIFINVNILFLCFYWNMIKMKMFDFINY